MVTQIREKDLILNMIYISHVLLACEYLKVHLEKYFLRRLPLFLQNNPEKSQFQIKISEFQKKIQKTGILDHIRNPNRVHFFLEKHRL